MFSGSCLLQKKIDINLKTSKDIDFKEKMVNWGARRQLFSDINKELKTATKEESVQIKKAILDITNKA